jgi:DNA-directed RNA polymerase subunit beta
LIELINAKADIDDIDLSNRRGTVGEQLSQQFGVGLARMARTIRERMNVRDNEVFTPIDLINAKTLSSVINNSFFGTKPIVSVYGSNESTCRDNAQKKIICARPGGLRERELDLRRTHLYNYGRLCPLKHQRDQTLV